MAVRIEGETNVFARVDQKRIRQVLSRTSSPSPSVHQQGEVVVHVDCDGRWARLRVHDTSRDHQERAVIFQEYKQTKDERARRRGTGLGLAIARRLVLMHGGRIDLQSQVGQGPRSRSGCLPGPIRQTKAGDGRA